MIPRRSPVEELAKLTSARVDSITLQLALREHYETYYGIYNHEGDSSTIPPLTLVTMQRKERYEPYGRYRRLADNFLVYGIRELFGYTLSEFLDLPRVKINTLMDIAAERKRVKVMADVKGQKAMEAHLDKDVFGTS